MGKSLKSFIINNMDSEATRYEDAAKELRICIDILKGHRIDFFNYRIKMGPNEDMKGNIDNLYTKVEEKGLRKTLRKANEEFAANNTSAPSECYVSIDIHDSYRDISREFWEKFVD